MKCFCASTRRAARLLTRHYEEYLRPCGLTPSQFELLAHLEARPGVSQTALAEALAADQTTLSRGLRLLAERGWVTRDAARAGAEIDRRQVRYQLTTAGVDGVRQAEPHWRRAQAEVQARLGAQWETDFNAVERLASAAGPS